MTWLNRIKKIGWCFFWLLASLSILSLFINLDLIMMPQNYDPKIMMLYMVSLFGTIGCFYVYILGKDIQEKRSLRRRIKELEDELEKR